MVDENKNNNTGLVTDLRELTRGLVNTNHTDQYYPIDVFMWDTASRSFILEKIKPYIPVEREYYYLKIGIGYINEFEEGILSMLIGKTKIGDWIGICKFLNLGKRWIEKFCINEDNASQKIEYASLVSILKDLETKNIFSEENFYYIGKGIVGEIAQTRDNLLHNLLRAANIMHFSDDYEKGDFGEEGFFGENYYEDNKQYNKLQRLSNIIKTRFKDIKIYWFGYGEIDVYIVGKIETGDWVGIRSRLCRT